MRLIDEDEVVKFYKNMGKQFPELSDGVHFSISDIISNLDNIPTVKKEKIMTMTNAEWCIKQGYKFKNIDIRQRPRDLCIYGIYIGNALIDTYRCTTEMTYIEVVLKWLDMEHKEPILDEAEKRYLSGVIRPFRGRAVFVKKIYHTGYTVDYEQIIIRVKSIVTLIADIPLPFFKKGEMYKGMKLNREYTLEELGL